MALVTVVNKSGADATVEVRRSSPEPKRNRTAGISPAAASLGDYAPIFKEASRAVALYLELARRGPPCASAKRAVAEAFDIPIAVLETPSKLRAQLTPRYFAMALAMTLGGIGVNDAMRHFGMRDHKGPRKACQRFLPLISILAGAASDTRDIRDRLGEALRRWRHGLKRPLWPHLDENIREQWRHQADLFERSLADLGLQVTGLDEGRPQSAPMTTTQLTVEEQFRRRLEFYQSWHAGRIQLPPGLSLEEAADDFVLGLLTI